MSGIINFFFKIIIYLRTILTLNLRSYIRDLEYSTSSLKRSLYSCYHRLALFQRFIASADYRSTIITRWKYRQNHYQGEIFTKSNRYPLLFSKCAGWLKHIDTPSLLSFGCSTGEEVATIGTYLPQANVTGVDINNWCIAKCRKQHTNSRFSFYHRMSWDFTSIGPFDAIFCMAVFQHTSNRNKKNNETVIGFTFEQFEKEIALLDRKLKPGGLFIIDNADFNFMDTTTALQYRPLDFEKNQFIRKRPLFDRDNKKVSEISNLYRIFEKVEI